MKVNFVRRSIVQLEALHVRMRLVEISQEGSLKKLQQSYKSGTAPTLFPSKILLTFANFFYRSISRTTYVDLVQKRASEIITCLSQHSS